MRIALAATQGRIAAGVAGTRNAYDPKGAPRGGNRRTGEVNDAFQDTAPILLALVGLLAALAAGSASAIELRDAELVAAGSPVLQNGTGTVRLEDGRLGRLGARRPPSPSPALSAAEWVRP